MADDFELPEGAGMMENENFGDTVFNVGEEKEIGKQGLKKLLVKRGRVGNTRNREGYLWILLLFLLHGTAGSTHRLSGNLAWSERLKKRMPSRTNGSITQDWTPAVIHKRPQKASEARDPKAVNAAIRAGGQVQSIKKFEGGTNKKVQPPVNTRKLDEETEPAALQKVPVEVRHAIQKARLDQKLSQAELGKRINERAQVIQEYESGKAIPNQAILSKLEKALGVKLRGKLNSQ